ncbi:hypothetical protein FRC10_005460 [Ceratobasidium sp. 414]|nr:hypothetical protein FRC10_005460 [Ceratobasidium sp. 414]
MTPIAKVVGELACQQNSYLNDLQTTVVSCAEVVAAKADTKRTKKNKERGQTDQTTANGLTAATAKLWEIECEDSILFPEDSHRRMDHMQQHTGQHLLSAVMDTYPGLETIGWSMGASIFVGGNSNPEAAVSMNYVELGRKPTDAEIAEIQDKCNELVRQNRPITVSTPLDAKHDSLPSDYDKEQGIIRVIIIDGIDSNPRTIASTLSSGTSPSELSARATQVTTALRDAVRAKRKLETEVAGYVAATILREESTWAHRADAGLEFLMDVAAAIPADKLPGALVLAAGVGSDGGPVLIIGSDAERVQGVTFKATAAIKNLKGGGKGVRWQGKVQAWEKGNLDALEKISKIA